MAGKRGNRIPMPWRIHLIWNFGSQLWEAGSCFGMPRCCLLALQLLLVLALRLLQLALRHALALSPPSPAAMFLGDKAALAPLKCAVVASSMIPSRPTPASCRGTSSVTLQPPLPRARLRSQLLLPPHHGPRARSRGLRGALPAALLSSFPFLTSLSLTGDRFHGALPDGGPTAARALQKMVAGEGRPVLS